MPKQPYDQLFIYEMDGDLRPFSQELGTSFLGLWLEDKISYLFFSQARPQKIENLARQSGAALLSHHQLSYEEWQGGMDLEPFEVGPLRIAPAWADPGRAARSQTLLLDPGLVFGNGLHPTTRHCLEFLVRSFEERPPEGVLDLGCGTGILGLAAALLGAEQVLAVDLNPLCVSTTQNNARLNRLALEVREGPAGDFLARPAQLVLANLHWEAQKGLWGPEAPLAGKRDLILSGITRSQVGKLEDIVRARGFEVKGRKEADSTWFTLWARRPR